MAVEDMPAWIREEEERAGNQARSGDVVNPKAKNAPPKQKPIQKRIAKGFRPTEDRADRYDELVLKLKLQKSDVSSTDLIDEALDLLFKKYANVLKG